MNKDSKITLMFGVCVGSTLLATFCAIACADRLNSIKKIVGESTERIQSMSHVEVDQQIINNAVSKVVREKSGDAVKAAVQRVESATNADIQNRVRQAVEKQYSRIGDKVAKRIAEEISDKYSRQDIIDKVVSQTVDELTEKLGDELDEEIGRIGKVYQGIAAALK